MLLMVDNEACFSLQTHWLVAVWDYFSSLVFLELKGLEELNNYLSPSSLLVVKLIHQFQ
jgi:hypothetical protein